MKEFILVEKKHFREDNDNLSWERIHKRTEQIKTTNLDGTKAFDVENRKTFLRE